MKKPQETKTNHLATLSHEDFLKNREEALMFFAKLKVGDRCWYSIEKTHSRVSGEIVGFTKTGKVRIKDFCGRIYAAPMVRVSAI